MAQPGLYDEEHEAFRGTVRRWVDKHVRPHAERWDAAGIVDRELFTSAARDGVLGFAIPEEYGGGGVDDFRFNAVMAEELGRSAVSSGTGGVALSNDIVFPYFTGLADTAQRERWLPGIASGELIVAVAMTEPGTGSAEVENAIADHPDILEVAVIGRPDERWGQVPVAIVAARPDATLTLRDLIQFLSGKLASFKMPKDLVVVAELPRNASGKVVKGALRTLDHQRIPDVNR